MEKMTSKENSEKDLRSKVVEALKNNAEGAKELFLEWRLLREAEVEILGKEKGAIRLLIESADIFAEAGMIGEAMENLYDAHIYASQMHDTELISEIERKTGDIENGA